MKIRKRLNDYYIINHSNYTLMTVSLCKFLYGFYTSAIGSLLVPIGEKFNINIGTQSTVFLFNYFGQIIIIFFVGYFADKLGKKFVNMIFLVLLSLFALLFNYAENFYLFLILFLFMGLFGFSVNVIADATITDTFEKKRGYYLNIAHTFLGIGALSAPLIFNLISVKTGDFRSIYFVLFIISAIIIFLIIATKYPSDKDEKIKPSVILEFFKNSKFMNLCIFALLSSGSIQAVSGWIPTLFQKYLNISSSVSNYSLSFFWLAIVIGRIITAFLSKVYREETLLKIMNIMMFLVLATSFFLNSYSLLLIDYLVFGLLAGGSFPLVIACSTKCAHGFSSTRLAIIFSFTALGMFAIPAITGLLAMYFIIYKIIAFSAIFFMAYIFIFFKKMT